MDEKNFYEKAKTAKKIYRNRRIGLIAQDGEVLLEPRYMQIEVCKDFVYFFDGQYHSFEYKSGLSHWEMEDGTDFRFYENGCIGLKDSEGNILFPAEYDQIVDWDYSKDGSFDVVYVRKDEEYHYYNHAGKEILSNPESLKNDKYPLMPFSFDEDQNRNVLLCIEPTRTTNGNRDCYAYGQRVKLSRIPIEEIRVIFNNCNIIPVSEKVINHFYEPDTYIYSARTCSSKAQMPIKACIKKFASLGSYDSSWNYLLQVSFNHNTCCSNEDVLYAISWFEGLKSCGKFSLAIGYDDTLQDGEIKAFQVQFFWDDMGAFLRDKLTQELLPKSSLCEIKKEFSQRSADEQMDFIRSAYWWLDYNENRSWDEVSEILTFLEKIGCDSTGIITRILGHRISLDTEHEREFQINLLKWAIEHGAKLNHIRSDEITEEGTLLDRCLELLAQYLDEKEDYSGEISALQYMISMLRSAGGMTVKEKRSDIKKKADGMPLQEWVSKYLNS